ncbi:regulator of G protein signaling superfamily [Microthyrium microscopicum]|uniref:Regulator of G protein signaling superfamily n=1 Tax=Microthyrium microscopicum TaxID=703497 RepID=A0A6A6U756_9PEZI|nr:regulator of G protein signaling superfamily [Microthyrium microscopicum]
MEELDLPTDRSRLPTLFEVLSRQTLPPVDLFSLYIYMRDQQRSVDYLDFWLDVTQHMSLCRHYVRELTVIMEDPEDEEKIVSQSDKKKHYDWSISQFLRQIPMDSRTPSSITPSDAIESAEIDPSISGLPAEKPATDQPAAHPPVAASLDEIPSIIRPRSVRSMDSRSLTISNITSGDLSSVMPEVVDREAVRASAERILHTYLLPGAEREIVLPRNTLMEVSNMIKREDRDDPEVFEQAKDYVFQAIERDAYPGFLQLKALGNMVPGTLEYNDLGSFCLLPLPSTPSCPIGLG